MTAMPTDTECAAARELIIRGPLTAVQMEVSDIGETSLELNPNFTRDPRGVWRLTELPTVAALADPADRQDAQTVAALVLLTLEAKPSETRNDAAPLTSVLGTRAMRLYTAAVDGLLQWGLIDICDDRLVDRTGWRSRPKPRPEFSPQWSEKVTGKARPVPVVSKPRPVPEQVSVAPPAPKREPAQEAQAPAVAPVAADMVMVPADLARRWAEAAERQADALERSTVLQADTAGLVGMGSEVQYSADAARLALAQHVAVLIGAHGPITKSELTANRLSKAQRDTASSALAYAVGVGGLKLTQRRYHLSDVTRLGWTTHGFRDAVVDQKERQAQRAKALAERQARADAEAANRETERALAKVLSR